MANPQINSEQDLVNVSPKPLALYEEESLAALTVYSLYWLQEWGVLTTIEAVTVLNWRLFPDKFSMVAYRQFPDAFRTNRSLMQGQPKYRDWLTGSAKHGYSLNERGREKAAHLIEYLGAPSFTDDAKPMKADIPANRPQPKKTQARTIEPEHETARVRSSRLFRKWLEASSLGEHDVIHLYSLLGVFDHTPKKLKRKQLRNLESRVELAEDKEVLEFLKAVREAFPDVLNG